MTCLSAEPDALDRYGLLLHHRALRPQGDLVLLLGDGGAGMGGTPVGISDRFAFDGTSSRDTGTVTFWCSVTTCLRSRARPVS